MRKRLTIKIMITGVFVLMVISAMNIVAIAETSEITPIVAINFEQQDYANFKANEIGLTPVLSMVENGEPVEYEKYENILAYSVFLAENEFSSDEIALLSELVEEGYSTRLIQEVYNFWKTTDEDFSMIRDLCELSDEFYGLYWVENAFNKLTNNSHGVLNRAEIEAYYEKGLTHDDIYTANILSRREGQTIQGILEDMLMGKSTSEIMREIGVLQESGTEIDETINNTSPAIALKIAENDDYINTNNLSGDTMKIADQVIELDDERYNKNAAVIRKDLAAKGIVSEKIDIMQKMKDDYNARIIAIENGFDSYLIQSFRNRGYTYLQIQAASELFALEGIDPLEALKIVERR
ncbi:MAG: hypothetical protein IKB50_01915 [Clostridia bacterium]|nr:hypothetical protein [Clostridia bacterium]